MAATASTRRAAPRARPTGVRWDRVGRIAMLLVLIALLYLYLGAARSYLSTTRQAHQQRADIHRLEADNARLRARRTALERTATLEQEARQLGMIRPGERPYILEGLPAN
jgi:cell division protein FtsB